MPDEALIAEIERVLADVVELGAAAERTRMVPNLEVTDASPTGLSGFVTVKDDRDGDNILAKKVPSVIYSDGDLVNVLFVLGGEAIAFQQGSQSVNAGIWQIVAGTSTDIYYNSGDVGIGKSVAPDARLELLDTAQAQLRLTHTEDTKFADFTLDTNHDLTITPSSTGQIILQPTTDSVDFFQVLDADGGTPVLNVDSTNERVGIGNAAPTTTLDVTGTVTLTDEIIHAGDTDNKIGFTDDVQTYTVGGVELLKLTEAAQDLINLGPGSGDVDIDFNGDMFLRGSDGNLGIATTSPAQALTVEAQARIQFSDALEGIALTATSTGGVINVRNGSGVSHATFDGRTGATNALVMIGNVSVDSSTGNARFSMSALSTGGVMNIRDGSGVSAVSFDGRSTSTATQLSMVGGAIQMTEMTAPASPAANATRTFAEDNAGTTRQRVKFSSGNTVTIAEDGGLQTYTPTNVTTDRSYDANATSVAELADVLGTLIADFQTAGILG